MRDLTKFYNVFEEYVKQNNIKVVFENNDEFYFAPTENLVHLGIESKEKITLKDLYKTFHAASHSTMNITKRDASNYAIEEVVADMCASKILNKLGIYQINDFNQFEDVNEIYRLMIMNVSYSACWFKRILDDNKDMTSADVFKKIEADIIKSLETIFKEDCKNV